MYPTNPDKKTQAAAERADGKPKPTFNLRTPPVTGFLPEGITTNEQALQFIRANEAARVAEERLNNQPNYNQPNYTTGKFGEPAYSDASLSGGSGSGSRPPTYAGSEPIVADGMGRGISSNMPTTPNPLDQGGTLSFLGPEKPFNGLRRSDVFGGGAAPGYGNVRERKQDRQMQQQAAVDNSFQQQAFRGYKNAVENLNARKASGDFVGNYSKELRLLGADLNDALGQARGQDTSMRGQDLTYDLGLRGQDVTMRGQDFDYDLGLRGQDVTMRGQDMDAETAKARNRTYENIANLDRASREAVANIRDATDRYNVDMNMQTNLIDAYLSQNSKNMNSAEQTELLNGVKAVAGMLRPDATPADYAEAQLYLGTKNGKEYAGRVGMGFITQKFQTENPTYAATNDITNYRWNKKAGIIVDIKSGASVKPSEEDLTKLEQLGVLQAIPGYK